MTMKTSTALLTLVMAGLLIMVTGCSDSEITSPDPVSVIDSNAIAEDPFDNVLKSLDEETPVEPQARCLRLAQILDLTEDQLADMSAAYTTFREGVADLRTQVQDGEITMEEARAAAALLREDFEAELQLILTPEQWDILQDLRYQARVRDPQHNQDPDAVTLWGGILEEIGADEAQIAAVVEALDTLHVGIHDVRDQMHEGTLTNKEACDAVKLLREDFDLALQTILTEEQYQALLELRPDGEGPKKP